MYGKSREVRLSVKRNVQAILMRNIEIYSNSLVKNFTPIIHVFIYVSIIFVDPFTVYTHTSRVTPFW